MIIFYFSRKNLQDEFRRAFTEKPATFLGLALEAMQPFHENIANNLEPY
jgi:hypothetical protein